MSLQSERIQLLMQRLSLTEMARGYEALAEQAAQESLPYCDFLEQVLESEANVRQERNIKVRTQLAGFPDLKRLEQFDFKFPTSIDEKKIRELASLRFLERHENALFLGPPGVGKTHLAVSLGLEAIRHGFSVYFVSLPDLLDRLVQAQAENRMRKEMSHLCKCRLLVLDEIGYRSLDKQATTCLFQLISERCERGSMILTSNKSYGEWGSIFQDNVIASAILDRLLHHSHTINIKGQLPAEGQAQGRRMDGGSRRSGRLRRCRMIPAPRLRLKRRTGWFAAGHEVVAALPLLSDAAFRLYVFLCLNVDRLSARMIWEPMELANLLQRDRQSVTDALEEELCRCQVCRRHPDADKRIAIDRLSVEICDRFWPYEKPPVEEFGIDQNRFVQQTRQFLPAYESTSAPPTNGWRPFSIGAVAGSNSGRRVIRVKTK